MIPRTRNHSRMSGIEHLLYQVYREIWHIKNIRFENTG
jgi:hypothetical protein